MKKIKVLFLQSQTYFGADSMVHSLLIKYFDREQVEVFVACSPGADFNAVAFNKFRLIPNIHIRPTYFGPSLDVQNTKSKKSILIFLKKTPYIIPTLISLIQLTWFVKKNGIDIIHGTEKPRDAFYGILIAKITGSKMVIHLHVKPGDWIRPIVRWAIGHADGIVGVSKFVADITRTLGYRDEKIYFVLNSLDLDKWNPLLDKEKIRREFYIKDDTVLITIVSRLFKWKGHTELLKALAIVKKTFTNFKLLIVGEDDPRGDTRSGSYTSELKNLVKTLGLLDNVLFVGFRDDIPEIMAASDIYAMPSYEEPQGVVFLEAMAMQKPIIALNNGGTPEVVEPNIIGLLSEPHNIDQLAENILTLIQNPELRVELGFNGRKAVELTYTPQNMASNMLKVYKKVLT